MEGRGERDAKKLRKGALWSNRVSFVTKSKWLMFSW